MGKKGRKRVHDFIYSPMTGVQTDFLALLKKFVDSGSVRYEKFAEIWRASKMILIFSGRQSDAEVREVRINLFSLMVMKCVLYTLSNIDNKWDYEALTKKYYN